VRNQSAPKSVELFVKPPRQGRSRASLARMLDAAEALMVDRGSDDFTLIEVGRDARVSIGSIYNRFASKEELLHAVHARAMARMAADQARITVDARSRSTTPMALVEALLENVAEFLKDYAPVMRPLMLRAASDVVVLRQGAAAYDGMVDSVAAEMLLHRSLIRRPDPEAAVRTLIRVAYAAFARELGFGIAEGPGDSAAWAELKSHVAAMGATYLYSADLRHPGNHASPADDRP
jgi:AcrR family transcriptional regulator